MKNIHFRVTVPLREYCSNDSYNVKSLLLESKSTWPTWLLHALIEMLNIPNQTESKSQQQLVNNHLFLSMISVSSSVSEQDKDHSETFTDSQLLHMTGTKHKSRIHAGNWTNTNATSQKALIFSTSLFLPIETSVSKPAEEERSAAQPDSLSPWTSWSPLVWTDSPSPFHCQTHLHPPELCPENPTPPPHPPPCWWPIPLSPLPPFHSLLSFLSSFDKPPVTHWCLCWKSTSSVHGGFFLSLWNGNVSSLSHKHRNSHLLPLSRIHTHTHTLQPRLARLCTHTHTQMQAWAAGVPPPNCGSVFLVCVNSGCPGLKDCPPFSFLALTGLFLSFLISLFGCSCWVIKYYKSDLNLNEFNSRFNHWDSGSQAVFTK